MNAEWGVGITLKRAPCCLRCVTGSTEKPPCPVRPPGFGTWQNCVQ
ncbi:MAG: hypothetical protein KatS3mg110_2936 [Pirellulaceae bacterium]|nr:MAG: hypothetical protein KatS3mg110_2936 [Pirellulaceae bacterium]